MSSRAIHEGVTDLTDEELTDFINIVKNRTYAYFRIQVDDKKNQNSSKVFFVNIVSWSLIALLQACNILIRGISDSQILFFSSLKDLAYTNDEI